MYKTIELFDEVWILPVYRHAYSSKRTLESFDNRYLYQFFYHYRLRMLDLSLDDCHLKNRNVFIKELEKVCFDSLFPQMNPSDPSISVIHKVCNN